MIEKGYVLKDSQGRFYDENADDFVNDIWVATFFLDRENAEWTQNDLAEEDIFVVLVQAEYDGTSVKVVET
jgi:hypothetical protein